MSSTKYLYVALCSIAINFGSESLRDTCRRGGNHLRYVFLRRVGIYLLLLILMITSDLDAVIGNLKGNTCISSLANVLSAIMS